MWPQGLNYSLVEAFYAAKHWSEGMPIPNPMPPSPLPQSWVVGGATLPAALRVHGSGDGFLFHLKGEGSSSHRGNKMQELTTQRKAHEVLTPDQKRNQAEPPFSIITRAMENMNPFIPCAQMV